MSTHWPICTRHLGDPGFSHAGNENSEDPAAMARYVDSRGDATCSCCDPVDGFPCSRAEAPR